MKLPPLKKIRPFLTIEQVLRAHEAFEQRYPPGHEARAAAVEHLHLCHLLHAAQLRELRQFPNDLAKLVLLGEMAVRDAETGGALRASRLAMEVLGRKQETDTGVERLRREYSKLAAGEPPADRPRRGVYGFLREVAARCEEVARLGEPTLDILQRCLESSEERLKRAEERLSKDNSV